MKSKADLLRVVKEVHDQNPLDEGPMKRALGNKMPSIEPTRLGRMRLQSALKTRFGELYRNHPVAKEAMDHFDKHHEYVDLMRRLKGRS